MKTVVTMCVCLMVLAGVATAETVFSNVSATLAPSYASLGYQATQTREFGDRITLGGTGRTLSSATVTLVDWAKQEDYDPTGVTTGFYHDFTLSFYQAGSGYSHGDLIASVTQTFFVPYRPTGWAYNGYAANITFDLSSANIVVPDEIVYGLTYNTQTYGPNPIGVSGPYCSLNFGLRSDVDGGITVGSTDLDELFWNTSTAGWYTDGGLNGVGVFRMDDNWSYVPMIELKATPEPATLALVALGGLPLLRRVVRRRR